MAPCRGIHLFISVFCLFVCLSEDHANSCVERVLHKREKNTGHQKVHTLRTQNLGQGGGGVQRRTWGKN